MNSNKGLCRGKRIFNEEWEVGNVIHMNGLQDEIEVAIQRRSGNRVFGSVMVMPDTISRFTELTDKNGKMIFEGDITELTLPDGEVRRFLVEIKTVVRTVKTHPNFDDQWAKVSITGVVFSWNGYSLFPCVDESGRSDVSKMSIVGNRWDNPQLLTEKL